MVSINKLNTFLLFALFTIFFTACEKDNIVTGAQQNFRFNGHELEVVEDRIHFSSELAVERFLASLQTEDFSEKTFFDFMLGLKNETEFLPHEPFQSEEVIDPAEREAFLNVRKQEIDFYANIIPGEQPELSDESYFISDMYFASILNQNGEIVIGDQLYKYTPIGLFVTALKNEESLHALMADDSALKDIFADRSAYSTLAKISDDISYFYPEVRRDISIGGFNNSRDLNFQSFDICAGMNSNTLWNVAFGPSADCSDHFDSKRRIKTKAWNQNFLVYSSLGFSVRSQKKTLGVWWAQDIDEIQIGYDYVSFLYPGINVAQPQQLPDPFTIFQLPSGTLINRWGATVQMNPADNFFSGWPFRNDDLFSIDIYTGLIGDIEYTFNTGEFNGILRSALQGYTNSTLGSLVDEPVNIFDMTIPRMAFTAANRQYDPSFNDNKEQKTLDWNTGQITFGGNPSTGLDWSNFGVNPSAESYDEAEFLVWGGGRRGSVQRGNRVRFTEE